MAKKQFEPLLASPITDLDRLVYPVLASAKLDGVRALVKDGVVVGRSLKPLPCKQVQQLFGHLEGFDGELIVGAPTGADVFNRTQSFVMSHEAASLGLPLTYHVFDMHTEPGMPYVERAVKLNQRLRNHAPVNAKLLTQHMVHSQTLLMALEDQVVKQGYEGLMVRDPNGIYKFGRSTENEGILLKLKRFEDGEAEVLGFEELMRNTNEAKVGLKGQTERSKHKAGMVGAGVLGALKVRDLKTKIEFSIGSGFTDDARHDIWKNRARVKGQLVKYKHQPSGKKEKPRFPVFLGFRSRIDL